MEWEWKGEGSLVQTVEGWRLQKEDGERPEGVNMAFQSLPRVFIAMEQLKPV